MSAMAYGQYGKQFTPLHVEGLAFKNSGWFVSPGITYMLPEDRNENRTMYRMDSDNRDTIYSGDFHRKGKIGVYVDAGRHHFLRNNIIGHLDYGVHFKMLRGREDFEGIVNTDGVYVPISNRADYSESFVGVFFNASNILQLSDNYWIQNSIGVNGDYRLLSNRKTQVDYGAEYAFPNQILGQLHYKLGFGWKPEPGIFIIPMIETPILTAYPWEEGKSTLHYFVGRNRPLIFTLRIQWLIKQEAKSCENQPGKNTPDLSKKKRKKSTNSLFGKDAKKMSGVGK